MNARIVSIRLWISVNVNNKPEPPAIHTHTSHTHTNLHKNLYRDINIYVGPHETPTYLLHLSTHISDVFCPSWISLLNP